jgi:hypothetical protein
MSVSANKPIVHLFTVCYNEQILLPYFLRHYGSFVEKMYFFDNHSTDRSAEIIHNHENTALIQFDTGNKLRDDFHIEIKNNCWKESRGKADLVIVCDIDEFLYHINIKEFLIHLKNEGYTAARPLGYHMVNHTLPVSSGQLYQEITTGIRAFNYDKLILFNPNMIQEMNFTVGCHECSPKGIVKIFQKDAEFKLLHYHYLDLQRVIKRHKKYAERLSDVNRKNKWGVHYLWNEAEIREIFRLYQLHALPVVACREKPTGCRNINRDTSNRIIRHVLKKPH